MYFTCSGKSKSSHLSPFSVYSRRINVALQCILLVGVSIGYSNLFNGRTIDGLTSIATSNLGICEINLCAYSICCSLKLLEISSISTLTGESKI